MCIKDGCSERYSLSTERLLGQRWSAVLAVPRVRKNGPKQFYACTHEAPPESTEAPGIIAYSQL